MNAVNMLNWAPRVGLCVWGLCQFCSLFSDFISTFVRVFVWKAVLRARARAHRPQYSIGCCVFRDLLWFFRFFHFFFIFFVFGRIDGALLWLFPEFEWRASEFWDFEEVAGFWTKGRAYHRQQVAVEVIGGLWTLSKIHKSFPTE